jgi:hypothetical protein
MAAIVVVANPNGITCQGSGFIITGRVTLTAGPPNIGARGTLGGFTVKLCVKFAPCALVESNKPAPNRGYYVIR